MADRFVGRTTHIVGINRLRKDGVQPVAARIPHTSFTVQQYNAAQRSIAQHRLVYVHLRAEVSLVYVTPSTFLE